MPKINVKIQENFMQSYLTGLENLYFGPISGYFGQKSSKLNPPSIKKFKSSKS